MSNITQYIDGMSGRMPMSIMRPGDKLTAFGAEIMTIDSTNGVIMTNGDRLDYDPMDIWSVERVAFTDDRTAVYVESLIEIFANGQQPLIWCGSDRTSNFDCGQVVSAEMCSSGTRVRIGFANGSTCRIHTNCKVLLIG